MFFIFNQMLSIRAFGRRAGYVVVPPDFPLVAHIAIYEIIDDHDQTVYLGST